LLYAIVDFIEGKIGLEELLTDLGLFYQSWTKKSELLKWAFTGKALHVIAKKQIEKYALHNQQEK